MIVETTIYLVGAAGLSLWVDRKWPALRPGLSYKLALHLILSTIIARMQLPHRLTLLTAVLIYCLLVGIWFLRALIELINKMQGGGGIKSEI